ncbi:MAG TPA: ABC transporter permease [Candidatus Doudnabacteria bacterium]|nr:ABC transporter permease [Candidatus Doudnabacteria bacterium]
MSQSFLQLFLMNFRIIYRNRTGLFFALIMPVLIYVALSLLPIGRLFADDVNYAQYVLPGIIALTIMQGGIYGLAYWWVDLKSRNVIKRFLVTPLKPSELMASVLLSRIIVALMQVVLLTLVGWIWFGTTLNITMAFGLVFAVLGAAIFLLLGLIIASFADTYEAAAPITAAVGLPLTFLGNIFYPISSLPAGLRQVAELLPITYLSDAMRSVYLNNGTWADWGTDAGMLIFWLVIITALAYRTFRLQAD